MIFLALGFILWAASIFAGDYVARSKNRSGQEGAIFGMLFGPVGVLIVACLRDQPAEVPESRTKSRMMPWKP
jgi:hypothetical protein